MCAMRFWNPTLPHPIAPQAPPDTAVALPVNAHSAARAARMIGMLRPLPATAAVHPSTAAEPEGEALAARRH